MVQDGFNGISESRDAERGTKASLAGLETDRVVTNTAIIDVAGSAPQWNWLDDLDRRDCLDGLSFIFAAG